MLNESLIKNIKRKQNPSCQVKEIYFAMDRLNLLEFLFEVRHPSRKP